MKKILFFIICIILFTGETKASEKMLLRWKFSPNVAIPYYSTMSGKSVLNIASKTEILNQKPGEQSKVEEGSGVGTLVFKPLDTVNARIITYELDENVAEAPYQLYPHVYSIDSEGKNVQDIHSLSSPTIISMLFVLPDQPVSVGSEWTTVIPKTDGLPIETKLTSTLIGFEKISEYQCAKIKNEISAEFKDFLEEPVADKSTGIFNMSGISYFAINEGIFIKATLSTSLNIKFEKNTFFEQPAKLEWVDYSSSNVNVYFKPDLDKQFFSDVPFDQRKDVDYKSVSQLIRKMIQEYDKKQ